MGLARVLPLCSPTARAWTRGSARPRASKIGHVPAQGDMETPCAQHGAERLVLRWRCIVLWRGAGLMRWSLARADQCSSACKHYTTQKKVSRLRRPQRAAGATCAARCSGARPEMLAMRVARCGRGVSAPHMHSDNSCAVLRCVALLDQDFNFFFFQIFICSSLTIRLVCIVSVSVSASRR